MLKYAVAALCLLATPAYAQEPQSLTVDEVMGISGALNELNHLCNNKVITDGAKQSVFCEPVKMSAALTWLIAGDMRKVKPVIEQYTTVRNAAVAALPRKADGQVSEDVLAKFAGDDAQWRAAPADVKLDRIPKAALEPLNLSPAILAALWPIIATE